jgi:diguanylate cyclase (GGDEF)-like protein
LLDLFGKIELGSLYLPNALALAVVATLGYLLGRRTRTSDEVTPPRARRELRRAQFVAKELGKISRKVRASLDRHHARLAKFKQRVRQLNNRQQEMAWRELCREAEGLLAPTLHLATRIATAYDQLRQQTNTLMTFTEVRTDPLTGIGNRRGLDDCMTSQFALMRRYDLHFSVAIFDIDHFKKINDEHGHLRGDEILQRLARVLDESVRETDYVARYGGEEFVVVMPQTGLDGAEVFAERLRCQVEMELPITVSGGLATARECDDTDALLARADVALYHAKSAGRNCVFRHPGDETEMAPELVTVPAGHS